MSKTIRLHDAQHATPNFKSSRPWREPNESLTYTTLLGSAGYPGLVEEMIAGHPRIFAATMEAQQGASDADWQVEAPEDATPAEAAFAQSVERVLFEESVADAANAYGDFRHIIGEAFAHAFFFGHYLAEVTWIEDPVAYGGARLELFAIHPSSVYEWKFNEGVLDKIKQVTSSGRTTIPASELIHICRGGAYPVGQSVIRPLAFWYEVVKQACISWSHRLENEAGVLVVRPPAYSTTPDTRENAARQAAMLDDWSSDRPKRIRAMPGEEIEFVMPSGGSDLTSTFNYFDSQVDQLLNRALNTLGLTAGSGSRALGEAVAVDSADKWLDTLNWLGSQLSVRLMPHIASRLGYSGRLPRMTVARSEGDIDIQSSATTAALLIDKGLLKPLPRLAEYYARLAGLPDDVVEEQVAAMMPEEAVEPAPEDGAAPIDDALAQPPEEGAPEGAPIDDALSPSAPIDAALGLAEGATVTVIAGPPGSGKSTIADRIMKSGEPSTLISVDALLYDGGVFLWTKERSDAAHTRALSLLERAVMRGDEHIVFDAPLTSESARARVLETVRRADVGGVYQVELIHGTFRNVDELLARNATRPESRRVPDRAIEAMAMQWQQAPPTQGEGWDVVRSAGAGPVMLADSVTCLDFNGEAFEFYRPLEGVELFVSFVENERQRRRRDDEYARRIERLQREQTDAIYAGLASAEGAEPTQLTRRLESIRRDYEDRWFDLLTEYTDAIRSDTQAQGADERDRQPTTRAGATEVAPVIAEAMQATTDAARRALAVDIAESARTMANRVHRETVAAWNAGTPQAAFRPRTSTDNLVVEARRPGNRAEELGRTEEATRTMAGGEWVIVQAERVAVRDVLTCDTCKSRDRTVFNFPDDLQAFMAAPEAVTPDPDCNSVNTFGSTLCRCGFIYEWARVS